MTTKLELNKPLFTAMEANSALTSELATYTGKGVTKPAIFMQDPAPKDAVLPYIVAGSIPGDRPDDTKNCFGREVFRDIRIYTKGDGDTELVEQLAETIRAMFHRNRTALSIDGFAVNGISASGPVSADGLDVYGRIITLRINLTEV